MIILILCNFLIEIFIWKWLFLIYIGNSLAVVTVRIMCACVCVFVYKYMRVYMFVCVYVCMCVCVHVCACVYAYVYKGICMCELLWECVHVEARSQHWESLFRHGPPCLWDGLSSWPELTELARLTDQRAPGISMPSPHLPTHPVHLYGF